MLTHGTNPKQVALTFDDGPGEWTWPLMRVLAKHKAMATFFVLGKRYEYIHGDHEVGNHSFDHACLGDLSETEVRENISACQVILGQKPGLFRPPYGRILNTPVDKIAESMGYRVVGWSCSPGDWAAKNTRDIVMHVAEQLHAATRGEIVLMHDGSPDGLGDRHHTVEAVEILLRMFPDREFCTVSQMDGLQ